MIPFVFVCLLEVPGCFQATEDVRVDTIGKMALVNGGPRYYLSIQMVPTEPQVYHLHLDQDGDGDILLRDGSEEPCWTVVNVRPPSKVGAVEGEVDPEVVPDRRGGVAGRTDVRPSFRGPSDR